MKRTILSRLACIAACAFAAVAAISCDEKPVQEKDPIDVSTGVSVPDTIYIAGEIPVPHPEIPMKIYDGKYTASDAGVSVETFDVTDNNFSITLRPGKDVASYKLDVYPLSILYNYMIDEGGLGADERTVESIILSHLFNAEGSGGYAFSAADLGDDYAEFTIDWANSVYAQVSPVPDAQYIIAVGACYDDSASEAAMTELALVYVKTTSQELIGNPWVEIDVNAQYKGAVINHEPNADCAGIYYFGTNQDMLDPYVDAFGDRMLRDLMRHWYVPNTPISVDDSDNLWYQIGPWENPDPTLMITTVAFGVDINGTPANTLSRVDFHLKEIPEDAEEAIMKYTLDETTLSATYAELEVELAKECRSGFHLALRMDDVNSGGNLASARTYIEGDDTKKAELATFIALYGYGVSNKNFSFDDEAQTPTGSAFSDRWVEYNLSPDTEYVIAYCGKNAYGDVSEVHFSEPFRTKPLVTDRPQDNKSACVLSFSDVTTTSFTLNMDYDPANTAAVNFICVKYGDMDQGYYAPADDASQEEWHAFFKQMNGSLFMNIWPRSMSGHDQYTLAGIDPGITIKYAYYAEDFDGVVSEIKVAEMKTQNLQVGDDPQVEINPTWDESAKTWNVEFKMVKDCEKFKYTLQCDNDNPMYLYRLGTNDMRAFEFYDHWYQFVGSYGLETNSMTSYQQSEAGQDYVALAVGWGRDADGNEVISKLFYYILTKDGEVKKISDYYPSYTEK